MRISNWRTTSLAATAFLLGTIAAGSGSLRAAWEPIARLIRLEDPPSPASANVLSEHEITVLDETPPQSQAELLLERSINHYRGANEQIAARVGAWRGRIELNERLHNLFLTAINSDDLTVRVAGVEVDIAARNLMKNSSTVDRLEEVARSGEQGPRANALWDLALVGNRGVDQARVLDILLGSIHDDNVNIRYWAVEGLAERAACGLAQSGMFSAAQRRTAVPRLLDFAIDGALDAETHTWVFQALRDITGQSLPHDARRWREWYEATER